MLNNFSISKRTKIKGKEQTSFCKTVQNKSCCTKVLLVMFNVNDYTLWFHSRTQYFDLAWTASYTKAHESTALHVSSEWLHLHRRKSGTTLYSLMNSTTGKYCSALSCLHLNDRNFECKARDARMEAKEKDVFSSSRVTCAWRLNPILVVVSQK